MKCWVLLLVFFNWLPGAKSQIPADQCTSTGSIAEHVKQHFKSDRDKLSAIYNWVTSNINYSTDSINIINLGPDPDAKITAAFRRKKGVCENYARIFSDICSKAGITTFVIDGYTKQNGIVDKVGHTWCAVKADDNWLLCDPTWDAGGSSRYFLAQPSELIHTHMPFDPMWQLLDHPITNREFYSDYSSGKNYFNYKDSITSYLSLDSLHQLRSTAFRIEKNGIENELVKNRANYVKMFIEMILQDKDVDLYNSSVADLNTVTLIYNQFIQYRNNQFTPVKPDNELKALLDGIDNRINFALKKLDEVDRTEAIFAFSTETIRDKLTSIDSKVKEQQSFLDKYLKTDKANRSSLFYNKQVTTSSGK